MLEQNAPKHPASFFCRRWTGMDGDAKRIKAGGGFSRLIHQTVVPVERRFHRRRSRSISASPFGPQSGSPLFLVKQGNQAFQALSRRTRSASCSQASPMAWNHAVTLTARPSGVRNPTNWAAGWTACRPERASRMAGALTGVGEGLRLYMFY